MRARTLLPLLGLLSIDLLTATPPQVTKVEPPSWWTSHSLNPVRLLIRGRNLRDLKLTGAGLKLANARTNQAGTALFLDVTIPKNTNPGEYNITLVGRDGTDVAPFRLDAPLSRQGRFQGFSPDDVVYLIMPDRFANGDPANDNPPQSPGLLDRTKPRYYHGGDLAGVRQKLPYLKDLGVTAIWLNPVYDNNNRLNERERYDNAAITDYHGYGATDFYAVDEHLGTLADLRALVDAAHEAGIKVIQDQVANHTGPYHPWVKDPPTPTWFNGTEAKHLDNTWQVWTLADPYAAPELRKPVLDGWFINLLPDLNQDDPETRRYFIQNTLWWVGMTGLDAIRQDTLPYVPRSFWRDWMAAIKREFPTLRVVGELFDGDPALVSYYQAGRTGHDGVDTGVDALFDFPTYFPLRRAFIEGKPLKELAQMLARDHLYPNANLLWTFLGLHDVGRFMSETGATAEGLKLACTFLMTARGVPLIYYGDEIGLPGGGDPDNRRDFPGGWPGDARDAFTAAGRTPAEEAMFQHVQRLARLRQEQPALRRGRLVTLETTDQAWAYARVGEGGPVLVALNNATEPMTLRVPVAAAQIADGATLRDALGGATANVSGGLATITLSARTGAVFVR